MSKKLGEQISRQRQIIASVSRARALAALDFALSKHFSRANKKKMLFDLHQRGEHSFTLELRQISGGVFPWLNAIFKERSLKLGNLEIDTLKKSTQFNAIEQSLSVQNLSLEFDNAVNEKDIPHGIEEKAWDLVFSALPSGFVSLFLHNYVNGYVMMGILMPLVYRHFRGANFEPAKVSFSVKLSDDIKELPESILIDALTQQDPLFE